MRYLNACLQSHWPLDAGQYLSVSPVDGIHLDEAAHAALGAAIASALR